MAGEEHRAPDAVHATITAGMEAEEGSTNNGVAGVAGTAASACLFGKDDRDEVVVGKMPVRRRAAGVVVGAEEMLTGGAGRASPGR